MRAMETLEAELVGAVSGSRLMEHVQWPRHAGTAEEREAFGYLQQTLDGYGFAIRLWLHDAYISLPVSSRVEWAGRTLEALAHSFSRSSPPDGLEGELVHGGGREVAGKIVLLGRPCALAFAREGARLLVTDLAAGPLEETARLVRGLGAEVAAVPADATRSEEIARVVADGRRTLGPVDVLVNFAGYVPTSYVVDVSVEEWDRVFAINVRGTMLCCQAVARQMIERKAPGSLVNISSGASTSARAGAAHYCGSKAAVNLLTEVLAIELGPHGIRVNAVAPGLVMDAVVRKGDPPPHPYVADMLAATPLGRTGSPEDIASAVLFLASDRAGWVTGEVVYVTGGSHCGRPHMAPAHGLSSRA